MIKKLKVIVSFTLLSYCAVINKGLKDFNDSFYTVLSVSRDNTLLYCRRTSLTELNDLMLWELYFLNLKLFIPRERNLDDNILIISQLNSLTSNSPKEKVRWYFINRLRY
jgi:hypothetical protein